MKLLVRLSASIWLVAGLMSADVTYTQTTKPEGGTLMDMMQKMASMPMIGRMSGGAMQQAFQEQQYDVFIKGNKMARWGKINSTIYDLDAGTITTIDNTKQTYRTETFDEVHQRMEEMQQRMSRGQSGAPNLDFDVQATNTGETRTIDGATAKETLITMTAKQANQQGRMVIKMHAWMVPYTPASKEAAEFTRKLGAKYAFALGGSGGPGMMGTSQGMSAALKEAFKQDGYPAVTEVEISGVTGGPMPMMGGDSSDPNAPLLKMLTSNNQFAQGSVDDSKFAIPAGFKEAAARRGRGDY